MYIAIEIDEAHGEAHILAYGDHEHCQAEAVKYVEETVGRSRQDQTWLNVDGFVWLVVQEDGDPDIEIRSATIPFGRIGDEVELLWLKR